MDEMTKRELEKLARAVLDGSADSSARPSDASYFAVACPQNILNLLEENRALQIELMRKTLALCSCEQRMAGQYPYAVSDE